MVLVCISWWLVMLNILSCTCWLLYVLNSVFSLLSFWSSLYGLDINPLSDLCTANILFHSVDSLCTLLSIPLFCRSFLVLYNLFLLPFPVLLGFYSKKSLPIPVPWSIMFSSGGFIGPGLILKSLIHFEFILVTGEIQRSNFILPFVDIQFSQLCYWK